MISGVKWVKFKDREGPVIHGTMDFRLTNAAGDAEKQLAVVCACEGSQFDAINMYDRGIVSVGLLQWAEHVGKVSRFLGHAIDSGCKDALTKIFRPMFDKTHVDLAPFTEGRASRWRFTHVSVPITTPEGLQDALYGCDGLSSSWNDERRSLAIEWARTFHEAMTVIPTTLQAAYAAADIQSYVVPAVRKTALFTPSDVQRSPLERAAQALYVAMAVNSPGGAQKAFAATPYSVGSDDWCKEFFEAVKAPAGDVPKQFATRYRRAKPIIENLYNVSLPL